MEPLNAASQRATCDDAMLTDVTDCADTCGDAAITNIMAADAVSSSGTADDNSPTAEKCTTSLDPYSYVQRGDYTSEVYKLELMNLPRRFGIAVSRGSTFLQHD